MTGDLLVVVDMPVLLAWFHDGRDGADARTIRDAHRDGLLTAYLLDQTVYELGELLLNSLRWPPAQVADQIEDVLLICGPPLSMSPKWRRNATAIAAEHVLSYYDAAFIATGQALGATVLTARKQLIAAGLAQTPAQFVRQHGDHIRNTP